MRRTFRALVPLLAVFAPALAIHPAATARAADTPPSFGEAIDVRVVNLEAVVTDRSGKLVTGLKPDDFRLRVDGKEVPIEYFSEVHDGQALAAPAGAPEGKPGAEAAVQGLAEGTVGTYYLVFIDDYFSIGPQRDLVLKALKADLGRLGPDDRMAIVAYDGGRLAMISKWSGSQADLSRAFDQAMARKTHGLERVTERRALAHDNEFASQIVGDNAPLDLSVTQTGLSNLQLAYGETLVRQVKGDIQAAVSAMRGFAAPRGRKVMLLLSGGWPYSISSYTSGGGTPTRELPEGEQLFRHLASTANLLGYTLYPVDVPGIQTGAADVEATGPTAASIGSAEQEVEGSLHYLAKETGGKAILNSNRALALASAREDTRSFYWLGFSPSWQRNDKTHDVKLEPRRGDLRIRTRSGFLDLSRKAEVTMKVESALLFGNPPDGLQMPMKVGTPTRSKVGEVEIPLTLALPVDVMTVLPAGNKYATQLELRFAASDAEGNTAEIPTLPVSLSSDHPPTPGKFVRYETKVKLHGKADHLVVALYDPLSGKIATAETDVKMP
jgi:VWFA-related protein